MGATNLPIRTTPSLRAVVEWLRDSERDPLVERDDSGAGPLFAVGAGRNQQGFLLGALINYLAEGGWVYCLDAGNGFDPYPLALATRARGLPAEAFLKQVLVSRAATCHQIVSVVEEMLLPLAENPDGKVVAVLGIDTLFVDEDIPLFERRYLFGRTLDGIGALRAAGIGCLVTYNPKILEDKNARTWHTMLERTVGAGLKPAPTQIKEDLNHGTHHAHVHTLP
jgi:hypothetical protein